MSFNTVSSIQSLVAKYASKLAKNSKESDEKRRKLFEDKNWGEYEKHVATEIRDSQIKAAGVFTEVMKQTKINPQQFNMSI